MEDKMKYICYDCLRKVNLKEGEFIHQCDFCGSENADCIRLNENIYEVIKQDLLNDIINRT